ncbi:MAG: diacylglycerol kinase family protein [Bacteroidales bacterium]|nr:diacylglycerol kinase family protein [Bacteroidales bacterium]
MKKSNKKSDKHSFRYQLRSFIFAFRGITIFLVSETKAIIHLAAAIFVIVAGIYLKISKTDWGLIIFAIALVFVTEMINTSFEKLTDQIKPDYNAEAERIKNIMAGAVLVSAMAAVAIGLLVVLPKLI